MLTNVQLQRFKSFQDASSPVSRVTFLVGSNASGKSNFLDALRFLQGVNLGLRIDEVLDGARVSGRELWPGIRGGSAETARAGKGTFKISTSWSLSAFGTVQHVIECNTKGEPALECESLSSSRFGTLFDTHKDSLQSRKGRKPGGSIAVAFKRKGSQGSWPSTDFSSARSVLVQYQGIQDADERVLACIEALRGEIAKSVFLDITPARMREYVPLRSSSLGANGENVSAILHRLCASDDSRREVVDWLAELCCPEVADLEFETTTLDDVMLKLKERDGTILSIRSLSDGTLRFLGQLAALRACPKGSLLLIEEIENGLHPARIHLLMELIEQVTKASGIQVIATTHSPAALAALSEAALESVIAFGRIPDAPGTIMKRLADLPSFKEIEARSGIERLFTTQWLERAL